MSIPTIDVTVIPGMENHKPDIQRVFKHSIRGASYFLKNGKRIPFVGGVYFTKSESEIAELEEEIKAGNPHMFIDENEKEVDASVTPEIAFRAKVIAEYKAAMAAQGVPMGVTKELGLNAQSTAGVASGAAGSISMNQVPVINASGKAK